MPVSIIIPAYNAAKTITDTLNSVLAQTYPEWEVVVVDDGSTDETGKLARGFARRDARFRIVKKRNGGEAAARNSGITKARYDWVLFLDSDDWISPVHLERMTQELFSDPTLDAVHCGYARAASDGTEVVDPYRPPTGDLFPTLARRAAFPVHACIVRKSLVENVGKFDTSLRTSPDWDLWQRIARTGALFGAVREVLAFYRMSPNAASLDACQLFKDGMRVLKQGHSPDARVRNAHPDHKKGEPPEQVQTQEFYLLSWCAGLLIGSGKETGPLLDMVSGEHYSELYPDAVAQCIFEAAPLPACQPPQSWERLWPALQCGIETFFVDLEKQSMTRDLAARAMSSLKRMILKSLPMWSLINDEVEETRTLLVEEHRQRSEEQKRLIEDLRQSKAVLEEERSNWQRLAEERQKIVDEIKQSKALLEEDKRSSQRLAEERGQIIGEQIAILGQMEQAGAALQEKNGLLENAKIELGERIKQLSAEGDELRQSYERQIGDLVLNRLRLRGLLAMSERLWAKGQRRVSLARLAAEKLPALRKKRQRVLTTVCDVFPIYSQTFVYQELTQLAKRGFDVRLIYSKLASHDYLSPQFGHLWKIKRRLFLNRRIHEQDFALYHNLMREKVEALVDKLCQASGLSRQALLSHDNFLQGFSFTRMAEAYRPQYLHSYFFYDRSLMALIAGYLLNIPRGISCYADHVLNDYELKVVPLHLELCDIIIATSARIKQELLEIAPKTDPNRILVKPNGIDTDCFPVMQRVEPAGGAPFRLVSVCRIEPKKGLLHLVEAVHLLREGGVRVEAHVVGTVDEWSEASRDYKRKLDQRISELSLWGSVHLEGRQNLDGVLRFLRIAHLFVAPFVETESGDKDGIPTAVLEGMATGLPVVATNAGSISEVIENGQEGFIVPQRDPYSLAGAIGDLIRDQSRRSCFGDNAAQKVRSKFDVSRCEGVFHERLSNLLASGSRHNGATR